MEIRILSYNIHKGFDRKNKRFVLHAIREAIRSTGADIVCLQEVIGTHREHSTTVSNWPSATQFEFLADELWPHYAYGRNAVYDAGHHGNAILSRWPITEYHNIDISSGKGEQRGILNAQITVQGTKVNCLCTHLGLVGKGRKKQFQSICELAGKFNTTEPLIIAGDFNDWSGAACVPLENSLGVKDVGRVMSGTLRRTFPSVFPLLALDRIYTRGLQIKHASVLRGEPWRSLSDHAPLFGITELIDANVSQGKAFAPTLEDRV